MLRVTAAAGVRVLSVTDNGIGLSSADPLRLFDLHAQLPGQQALVDPAVPVRAAAPQ
ncbi:MAG: hypothetical protein K2W80_14205 [Burkholderiales bacterium]|nr:hypothetical protein [Burkholderiales bacterium]